MFLRDDKYGKIGAKEFALPATAALASIHYHRGMISQAVQLRGGLEDVLGAEVHTDATPLTVSSFNDNSRLSAHLRELLEACRNARQAGGLSVTIALRAGLILEEVIELIIPSAGQLTILL